MLSKIKEESDDFDNEKEVYYKYDAWGRITDKDIRYQNYEDIPLYKKVDIDNR